MVNKMLRQVVIVKVHTPTMQDPELLRFERDGII